MLTLINNVYTRYAGDHECNIYLLNLGSSMSLAFQDSLQIVAVHLTSDEDYMKWLTVNADSLYTIVYDNHCGHYDIPTDTLLSESVWHDGSRTGNYYSNEILHREFTNALEKAVKKMKLID